MLSILKIAFLFIGVWFTFVNIARLVYKNNMPAGNLIWWTVGIVGFVIMQFHLI